MNQDINQFYVKDSVNLLVNFVDQNGSVINITGYTVYFTLKYNVTDDYADALIKKVVTSHTSPTLGQTTILLTSTDMDIDAGVYYYDIRYKDGSSGVGTIANGVFSLQPEITDTL